MKNKMLKILIFILFKTKLCALFYLKMYICIECKNNSHFSILREYIFLRIDELVVEMENFERNQENKLEESRFQLTKNLSTGTWLPKLNRVKLTKSKGKFIHTMGYSSDYMTNESKSQKPSYLYPEEALYLMENSSLLINYEINGFEIPMSIQQCYENFFDFDTELDLDPNDHSTSKISLDDYKVYSHLVRLGYILRRVSNETISSNKPLMEVDNTQNESIDFSKPLINRNDYSNLNATEIFTELNRLIPNIDIKDLKESSDSTHNQFRLLFDVYLPDKSFRKSKPLKEPIYCVSTSLSSKLTSWPNFKEFILNNTSRTSKTKNLYAFVDNGDVLFYSFDLDLNLPLVHLK